MCTSYPQPLETHLLLLPFSLGVNFSLSQPNGRQADLSQIPIMNLTHRTYSEGEVLNSECLSSGSDNYFLQERELISLDLRLKSSINCINSGSDIAVLLKVAENSSSEADAGFEIRA